MLITNRLSPLLLFKKNCGQQNICQPQFVLMLFINSSRSYNCCHNYSFHMCNLHCHMDLVLQMCLHTLTLTLS